VRFMFAALPDTAVARIGLRYITALTPAKHLINDVSDLLLSVKINDNPLESGFKS
jgi:hypothetical protein